MIFRWLRQRRNNTPSLTTTTNPTENNRENIALSKIDDLLEKGDIEAAEKSLNELLQEDTANSVAMLQMAKLYRLQGKFSDSIQWAERSLLDHENPAEVHYQQGETLLAMKDIQGALDSINTALALDENHLKAWLRYGDILARQEKYNQALDAYKTALSFSDEKHENLINLQIAQTLHALRSWPDAVDAYKKVLSKDPENVTAWTALGHVELVQDNDASALIAYIKAREICEKNSIPIPLTLELHLAMCYQYSARWNEALILYRKLHTQYPKDSNVSWYLSQCELAMGNWERGWEFYGSRFLTKASSWRAMPFAIWHGEEALNKTLLVLADQGLGDEIMFSSCVLEAKKRVGHLILECEPRLEKLFIRSFSGISVVASERERSTRWLKDYPQPDFQIASGDLPALFRQNRNKFPDHHGYLKADPDRIAYWANRLNDCGPGVKIGISWRGGVPLTRGRVRSTTAQDWKSILNTPNCQFINLQYGNYQEDLAEFSSLAPGRVHDFPEVIPDYDETAALVMALDLVITVCTSIVHLSGALGKEVWVLVPHVPGWRYQASGNSMPWYPSAHLFRQTDAGNWKDACQNLSFALQKRQK
ncbi:MULTISPECIES: tetratricopeptide repeat protein [Giesbergeria]|uniref:Tetratricopeptide repeat protein n=1 Tax=Giesbergeria sinuosa TaxID=80883 RepID=A0ABV9QF49_9BURK